MSETTTKNVLFVGTKGATEFSAQASQAAADLEGCTMTIASSCHEASMLLARVTYDLVIINDSFDESLPGSWGLHIALLAVQNNTEHIYVLTDENWPDCFSVLKHKLVDCFGASIKIVDVRCVQGRQCKSCNTVNGSAATQCGECGKSSLQSVMNWKNTFVRMFSALKA